MAVYDGLKYAHLLLRRAGEGLISGVEVPDGMSCEVQIRTILQHAYAELCHDRIYKSSVKIPVSAKRVVARCMALMETTDLLFCDAVRELEQVSSERGKWVSFLGKEYARIAKCAEPEDDLLAPLIVEAFLHLLDGVKMPDVVYVVASDPELTKKIEARSASGLFASPACLLCYWLVKEHQAEASRAWPADAGREDFDRVCNDLGFAA
jgi:putative GTP pyrophosphokinase